MTILGPAEYGITTPVPTPMPTVMRCHFHDLVSVCRHLSEHYCYSLMLLCVTFVGFNSFVFIVGSLLRSQYNLNPTSNQGIDTVLKATGNVSLCIMGTQNKECRSYNYVQRITKLMNMAPRHSFALEQTWVIAAMNS